MHFLLCFFPHLLLLLLRWRGPEDWAGGQLVVDSVDEGVGLGGETAERGVVRLVLPAGESHDVTVGGPGGDQGRGVFRVILSCLFIRRGTCIGL